MLNKDHTIELYKGVYTTIIYFKGRKDYNTYFAKHYHSISPSSQNRINYILTKYPFVVKLQEGNTIFSYTHKGL